MILAPYLASILNEHILIDIYNEKVYSHTKEDCGRIIPWMYVKYKNKFLVY